jgi:hypothetical protein
MAVINTTSVTEAIYTTIIADELLVELRPHQFMRSHFKMGRWTGSSKSYDFLLVDSSTTNSPLLDYTSTETTVGEDGTTAFTTRDFQTDKARVTAAVVGTNALVGDFTKSVVARDIQADITAALARTLAHKWEFDACANLANFSNTITAASGQLAYEDVLAAIAALEQANVTAPLVLGGHPKQMADLRVDYAGRTAEVFGNLGNDMQRAVQGPSWGIGPGGIPCFASTVVGSSSGNYQGAVFASGEALGYLEDWGPKIELWRDKTLATYIIGSMAYGSVEIFDARGRTLLSSTT